MDAWRAAISRDDAGWIQGACLLLAAAAAWAAAELLAVPGSDLEKARELGILSATTLAGYAKSRDVRAYMIAMSVGLATATALWLAWSARIASTHPWELGLLTAVLLAGLLRFDLAANGWDAPYTFYSEEGEAIAWADVVHAGGVLSRDTYCLYGPLATYPVAAAFAWFGPSIHLWRLCVYLSDLPALVAVFLLLRELAGHRWAAWAGVAVVCFHRMWPMPAMSWSLLRTGLGLAAIAAAAVFLRTDRRRWLVASGVALGAGLFFSQEAGIAAATAVAAMLGPAVLSRRTLRPLLAVGTGFAAVALPIVGWYAAHGAAHAMFENLFGFARLRVLGHGGQPFPSLASLLDGEAGRDVWAAYFTPLICAIVLFHTAVRALAGRWEPRDAARLGIALYGAVLFLSPLTRPDTTHILFAMTPAFVLIVDLLDRGARALPGPGSRSARSAAALFTAAGLAGLVVLPTDTMENLRLFGSQLVLNLTGRLQGPSPEDQRPLDLPRAGGVRIPRDRADEIEAAVRYVQARTLSGEPVWAFPNEPMLNFLAERPMASRYPLALYAVTRDQRLDLIESVRKSGARYAIVNTKPAIIDDVTSRVQIPEPWSYLDESFMLEATFGRLAVMQRKAAPEASVLRPPRGPSLY